MIIIHVEHFLNEEGRQDFPVWIGRCSAVLSRFEGFISIRQLADVNDEEACHLLMEFDNVDNLKAWSSSKEHDTLVAQLEPYRSKKQVSKVFEVGPRMASRNARTDIPGLLSI
jgi:antibiotic biosynthesis monooxygenase (ABM) superfamily enzyme